MNASLPTPVRPYTLTLEQAVRRAPRRGLRSVQRRRLQPLAELDDRQRELLAVLWRNGPLCRLELHQRTGRHPNVIGKEVSNLMAHQLIHERQTEPQGPGRPRMPLEINLTTRHVIGLAISPGRVKVARLNLRGGLVGKVTRAAVASPDRVIESAARLLRQHLSPQTLTIGLSVTGAVDPVERTIVRGTNLGLHSGTSLAPLYETAGGRPVVLENNLHAFAAQWMLTHQVDASEDVLIVRILDGELGAALLVQGKPNGGCVSGANELGHTRLGIETDRCYCGGSGCLERICSSGFLRRHGMDEPLMSAAANWDGCADSPIAWVVKYLAMSLGNVVNFVRPTRLVLVSELTGCATFYNRLRSEVISTLVRPLASRVAIESWSQPQLQSAEPAGWLALAALYRDGWTPSAKP